MVRANDKQTQPTAKMAARMPHQTSRTLQTLIDELLQASEQVRRTWEAWHELPAGSEADEHASDLLAALDVQVYVLGRKCDSVTGELEAMSEAMPEDPSDTVSDAARIGAG